MKHDKHLKPLQVNFIIIFHILPFQSITTTHRQGQKSRHRTTEYQNYVEKLQFFLLNYTRPQSNYVHNYN